VNKQLRSINSATKLFKWGFLLLLVITTLVFILFLVKMSQTSEIALQYDQRTQEQVGLYVMMLLFLGMMTLGSGVFWLLAGRRAMTVRGQLVEQLRQDLNRADNNTERMSIESRLRELGA
jgi:hypothetical protein